MPYPVPYSCIIRSFRISSSYKIISFEQFRFVKSFNEDRFEDPFSKPFGSAPFRCHPEKNCFIKFSLNKLPTKVGF